MGLDKLQRAVLVRAKTASNSELAVPLTEEACCYLAVVIASDLRLQRRFKDLPTKILPFFSEDPSLLVVEGMDFWNLMERLASEDPDTVMYFACLAALHKARLKYQQILKRQPIPTMDQVGPRGLLQFGTMTAKALTGFMLWRKWMFDIDNRAGQETGYLFEPIIANAIGGVAYSATKSPVRRHGDAGKGRQVDCIVDRRAYEIKMRVTIAASGQGRWGEELEFPIDARKSGYQPVLIVFDPTENDKLAQLSAAFRAQKGEVFVGAKAWKHLDAAAGSTMAQFLERYVRTPSQALLREIPDVPGDLPDLTVRMDESRFSICLGDEEYSVPRETGEAVTDPPNADEIPDDADEGVPGP